MTHSYLNWLIHTWHDSCTCTLTSFIRAMTHTYVTRLIRTWHDAFIHEMTRSYVTWLLYTWHDSFIRDTTHPDVQRFIHARIKTDLKLTWLIHTCHRTFIRDMTHSYMWHNSIIYLTHLIQACAYYDVCSSIHVPRGGGLGSRPKNMYGERLGDGVEYHLMKPTPRR